MSNLAGFMLNFAFNFLVALLVVRFIYYPSSHNKRYVITFLALNAITFFMMSLMKSIEVGIGVGFGLFAIFSILKYRTDPIPVREMTYLFVIAALPLMNSVGITSSLWPQLVLANLAVLVIMLFLERGWGFHYEASRQIVYERIELIRPDRRPELLADLQMRTGLKIKRIVIGKIDFLHDTANLKVYFDDLMQEEWLDNAEPAIVVLNKDDSNGFGN